MKKIILGISFILLSSAAQAATIFEDNFDSENGGVGALNYTGFSNFNVISGSVDLIGNGFYDYFPSNGLYVDLDGSTNTSGAIINTQFLDAGLYTLSFDLAGNQRNSAVETTFADINLLFGNGTEANQTYSLNQNDGFTTFSLDFSTTTSSLTAITFGAIGGDNVGMLLDNIVITDRVATTVPEPSILALFGLGLAGFGFASRKKKQA